MNRTEAANTGALAFAAQTDRGRVREHNEDNFLAAAPLFVVADGMGGHQAGEVASAIAINTLAANLTRLNDGGALARATAAANRDILRGAAEGRGREGMGCTLTAALLAGSKLTIAQVGDSRAYLLHHGRLQRITRDHSLVADLIAQGSITEEEARFHPMRSMITRALGADANVEPDLYNLHFEEGDRLLLCTDGLSGMVSDADLEVLLRESGTPEATCRALVEAANRAGGSDNITCVVVDQLDSTAAHAAGAAVVKKRRRNLAPLAFALALALVLGGAAGGVWTYAKHSFYLQDVNGEVVIYQGIPGSFAGRSLHWKVEATGVEVAALPSSTQQRLATGIQVDSLAAAEEIVESYEEQTADAATEEQADGAA